VISEYKLPQPTRGAKGELTVNTWTSYHNRITTPQEQHLYDHLLLCVELEPPEQVIERFRVLFIEGVGYPDRQIVEVLDDILAAKDIDHCFRYILNRCCHILINRWQSNLHLQSAIPTLIECLEAGPRGMITELSRGRSVRRLRQLVIDFRTTEQYLTLRRLAQVIIGRDQRRELLGSRPLGTLINRYPYLYEHCLVSEDSTPEHQQTVRSIQAMAQHRFEVDLSHYLTYRVRRARLQRQGVSDITGCLRPIENPTLLNDRELVQSLQLFSGHQGDGSSYRDGARRFLDQNCRSASYQDFKQALHGYLTVGIDPAYGKRMFNQLLADYLAALSPEHHGQPLNDFLMVRTCSQLFNFLVVDSAHHPQHYLFVDLINNIGPSLTTGLLLRLLLICRRVKPYLERRFSILFGHYESTARDAVTWLVKMLENLNLALSLNFGSLDLSHLTAI